MSGNVYKIIEVVGTSENSYEEAIRVAVQRAAQTIKAISWFEVSEFRGAVRDGNVTEFQVILKVGFKLVD